MFLNTFHREHILLKLKIKKLLRKSKSKNLTAGGFFLLFFLFFLVAYVLKTVILASPMFRSYQSVSVFLFWKKISKGSKKFQNYRVIGGMLIPFVHEYSC